jgi:hypothetical protein
MATEITEIEDKTKGARPSRRLAAFTKKWSSVPFLNFPVFSVFSVAEFGFSE